ncbi:Caspase-3 [Araneus ventricosus]|uniref:Caspase-3 n=1 Tax=Araneus ventricosus TaxID=182803 RepID=A0A4Y2FYX0_ARAVE|nr:Caspase-3 [Araneus ventricosus]
MSIESIDAGGVAQELSEKFKDLAVGDVSVSVSVNEKIPQKPHELTEGRKYGDCYIFDYQKFKKGASRPGSENDVARLKHDFTALNFNVYDYLNLTKGETLNALKEAAKKDHSQSKYFVCCFLTHGEEGKLLMFDKFINIDDILKCFSRSSCETLKGKPKIFIFQACRGSCCEEGVPIDSTDFGSVKDNPDDLDFLIVYSTYEGKVSFKTKDPLGSKNNHGSYFIDELCRTLEQFSDELDLLQILTIVNYRVAYLFETQKTKNEKYRSKKQMPSFTSRLRTEVKFNRKIRMFESLHTQYFDYRRRKTSSGLKSTEKPLEDKKIYIIQKPKRIMFLSLLNTRKNFESDLTYSASNLWSSVASKGYQREEKRNWSEKELMVFLKEVAGRDFSSTDCLICFIACKVKGDYLCDVKENTFLMQQIVEQFTGEKCPTLVQKPKIFIFMLSSPARKSWWPCVSAESTDGDSSSSMIPVHADILETAITFEKSWQLEGVTEKFCNIFGGESSEDFLSQLTRMNEELVKDYGFYSPSNNNLATFCVNSTLTKTLILNNTKCKNN